jgi:hypothetical protein
MDFKIYESNKSEYPALNSPPMGILLHYTVRHHCCCLHYAFASNSNTSLTMQ